MCVCIYYTHTHIHTYIDVHFAHILAHILSIHYRLIQLSQKFYEEDDMNLFYK